MRKSSIISVILAATSLILAVCGLLSRSTTNTQDQAGMKILTIQDNPALESPLRIDVYLQGKKIKSDVPFKADDNWIEDLQIFVTNKTDDEIKFVSFTLDFPTEHNGEEMMKRYRINYGKDEVFKLEDDAEERRIGKKESAVVTFNSNNPLSFEAFKHFKKSSPYDSKIWDRGILSVAVVEFENRAWYQGFDFDKKVDGTWEKNKEKESRLIERIKKAAERQSQIGFLKRSFTGKSQTAQCWTVPDPPRTGANRSCTVAAGCPTIGCTYFRPSLELANVGFKKINTSPICKKQSSSCGGCCEPNVPDLGGICRSE